MTKRQKVREGIADIFDTPLTDSEDEEIKTPRQLSLLLAKKIVDYLHSQGVVIQADGELPPLPKELKGKERDGYITAVHNLYVKAGYRAVKPLIEEGK